MAFLPREKVDKSFTFMILIRSCEGMNFTGSTHMTSADEKDYLLCDDVSKT